MKHLTGSACLEFGHKQGPSVITAIISGWILKSIRLYVLSSFSLNVIIAERAQIIKQR